MTNSNRHLLVASLTALFGLSAFAGSGSHATTDSTSPAYSGGAGYSAQGYREPTVQETTAEQVTVDPNNRSYSYTEQDSYYSDPNYRSSSASLNSGTKDRLQDPTNPRGAYDTDKSGYANRWNAEARDTIGINTENNYQRTAAYSDTSFTTTQSSADTALDPSVSTRVEKDAFTDHTEPSAIQRADVETTRQIRRELTKDNSLSVYGKNVKILTQDGVATLSGPVKSTTEKDKVEAAAEKIVGTAKVRNELEIKH